MQKAVNREKEDKRVARREKFKKISAVLPELARIEAIAKDEDLVHDKLELSDEKSKTTVTITPFDADDLDALAE